MSARGSEVSELPSSENSEGRDYDDEDGYDILFPEKPPPPVIHSPEVRVNAAKLRLKNKISNIIGDNTVEYLDYLTDMVYNYIYFDKVPPPNILETVKYIKNRLGQY